MGLGRVRDTGLFGGEVIVPEAENCHCSRSGCWGSLCVSPLATRDSLLGAGTLVAAPVLQMRQLEWGEWMDLASGGGRI